MGKIKKHSPVKLIIGFIFKEEGMLKKVESILTRKFGKIDLSSEILPFEHTDYYEKEFGKNLKRKFISFKKLICPEDLPKIKIFTNKIEGKLTKNSSRLINIDPGYLDLAKLLLASAKDYKHRIYLQKGIYAEVTLFYQNKSFQIWDWTYPDYRSKEYIDIFNRIREVYANQLKNK